MLSLRLADVIGPYDDSCRFWKYLLWAQVAKHWPITLDEAEKARKLSFTFSGDAVDTVVTQLLAENKTDGAYNIAMAEKVTLEEFVRYFIEGDDEIKYLDMNKGEGHPNTFYPSVDLGPVSI